MFEFPEELHEKIEHYRITKQYKKNMCQRILLNYCNFKKKRFELDPIPSKKKNIVSKNKNTHPKDTHLSCSAITTFTLARYFDFIWNKNHEDNSVKSNKKSGRNKDEIRIRDVELYDYYNYVIKTFLKVASSSNNKYHPLDQFSFMNILSVIKEIQDVLKEKTQKKYIKNEIKIDNDKIILLVIKLCDYFAKKGNQELQDKTHPYFCYIFLKIMNKWDSEIREYAKKVVGKDKNKLMKYNFEYFFNLLYIPAKYEMYREISLSHSGDKALFDVKRLIFSLLIVCMNDRFSNSLIRKNALQIVFENQDGKTGLWGIGHVVAPEFIIVKNEIIPESPTVPRSIPILSSIECMNHMMENKVIKEELNDYFRNLFIMRMWLNDRRRIGDIHDQSDEEIEDVIGWFPEYERDRIPKSWVTAHVLLFLKNFCEKLSDIIQAEARKDVGAIMIREGKNWDNLWDSYNFKDCLEVKKENPLEKYRSVLLFGPPGSGKSTIAKSLAKYIGWHYIELNPSSFLSKGTPHIVNEINEIFKKLTILRKAVIFFDEVDQLVRKRSSEHPISYEEMLLVTSLLPKFQELYDIGNVIFILATNHIENVDPATLRPGRIDMVLPVGSLSETTRDNLLQEIKEKNNALKDSLNKRKERVKAEKNFVHNTAYLPGSEILNLLKQVTGEKCVVFKNLFLKKEDSFLYLNKDYYDFHLFLHITGFQNAQEIYNTHQQTLNNLKITQDAFKKISNIYSEIHVPEEYRLLFSSSGIDKAIGIPLDFEKDIVPVLKVLNKK